MPIISVMAGNHLRKRTIWQDSSGEKAGKAEDVFYKTFLKEFENSDYSIESKPKDFTQIYIEVSLPQETLLNIYSPSIPIIKHGITPDYAIRNRNTGKTIYIEVKRQDGWVEGKKRKDGRGNAHERSCKFFTPGLLKILRSKGRLGDKVLPFWTIFIGDITRDPCRVREITCWYDEYQDHFFLWRDTSNTELIINHFRQNLKKLLDEV